MKLYEGGLQALHDKRINGIGKMADDKMGPMVSDAGQKSLAKIQAFLGNEQQPQQQTAAPQVQENSTAVNKQTGQRLIFKGGQWQPVQ